MSERYYVIYQESNGDTNVDQHDNKESLDKWLNNPRTRARENYGGEGSGCLRWVESTLVDLWHGKCLIIKGRVVIPHAQPVAIRWVMQDTEVER